MICGPSPQPYVHIPEAIGGNQSKRRRIGQVQAVPSPPQGVLSLPIIDPATIATLTTNIRSHRREAVLRIPHPLGGDYIIYQDDLLNLGADAYASANCLCALSELALSPDPTIRWFPPRLLTQPSHRHHSAHWLLPRASKRLCSSNVLHVRTRCSTLNFLRLPSLPLCHHHDRQHTPTNTRIRLSARLSWYTPTHHHIRHQTVHHRIHYARPTPT